MDRDPRLPQEHTKNPGLALAPRARTAGRMTLRAKSLHWGESFDCFLVGWRVVRSGKPPMTSLRDSAAAAPDSRGFVGAEDPETSQGPSPRYLSHAFVTNSDFSREVCPATVSFELHGRFHMGDCRALHFPTGTDVARTDPLAKHLSTWDTWGPHEQEPQDTSSVARPLGPDGFRSETQSCAITRSGTVP